MKFLVLLAFGAAAPIVAVADATGLDVGTMIVSYGVAAPFAGLCLLQLQRTQKRADAAEAKVEMLQTAAVEREREFAMRLAPLLYDGALLYQRGNERLAQGIAQSPAPADDDELHALRSSVEELLRKLSERER